MKLHIRTLIDDAFIFVLKAVAVLAALVVVFVWGGVGYFVVAVSVAALIYALRG